jgi:hypothetical protein
MLLPNRAYKSTFNAVCSSLISPSFSSNADTSSSILDVEVESISWTSSSGRETKPSPILYLETISVYSKLEVVWEYRTEFSRPHLRAPIRLIRRPDLPFLSDR